MMASSSSASAMGGEARGLGTNTNNKISRGEQKSRVKFSSTTSERVHFQSNSVRLMQGFTMAPNTPSFKFVALDGGGRHCLEGLPPVPDEHTPAGRRQTKGKMKELNKGGKKKFKKQAQNYQEFDSPEPQANSHFLQRPLHNR